MSRWSAPRPSLYDQLIALPEGLTGEIINGQLRAQPRPSGPHALAGPRLGSDIEGPYSRGRGGPGGWWIIDQPEIHFVLDIEVVVPDIAGWLQARLPSLPRGHRFEAVPDWVCEIFSPATKSPATKSGDREEKMPLYARYGVPFAWLVDPKARTLEAYRLADGHWTPLGLYRDGDSVCVAPFEAITLRLADLWA